MMIEISADVRGKLPAALAEKVREVDRALGRPAVFLRINNAPGGGRGSVNLHEGAIKLVPATVENITVIGEEIMHLHRWTVGGYPATEPLDEARARGYGLGLAQIAGHLDEQAFFPFLESIDLNPRGEVGAVMENTAHMLADVLGDVKAEGPTDYWRVTLAAIFVQANIISPADAKGRDDVLKLFERDELSSHAQTGRIISGEIVGAEREAPAEVEARVLRCFYEHLKLNRTCVRVHRYY